MEEVEPSKINKSSFLINLAGLIVFIAGSFVLFSQSDSNELNIDMVWLMVYAVVAIIFYVIQMLYHILLFKGKKHELLQRVDRGSLLYLIASIFCPIIAANASEVLFWITAIILWTIVLIGNIILITKKPLPRKIAPIFAFLMGFFAIIIVLVNIDDFSYQNVALFGIGSALLVGGGIVYAIKKPNPKPEMFGFHEIFHVLITSGTIFFYFLILALCFQ